MGSGRYTIVERSRLPRGPHRLTRAAVSAVQRNQLSWAAIEVVAQIGYRPLTVADIIGRARIPRTRFYELFDSEEDCFAAGFGQAMRMAESRLDWAVENAPTRELPDVLYASLRGYLSFLADEPSMTKALHVETLSAGERLTEQRSHVERVFARRIRTAYLRARAQGEPYPHVPDPVFDLLVGGIDHRVRACLRMRGASALPALAPTLHQATMALLSRPDYRSNVVA
ncbi:TetR/AcrR family transcriptional regulator [Nocardia sp. NPDC056100]|uniref:TetR/AcrR family transcriptional regulator n=1 Tax=Nocardia sp. NPDC056100 TaxID=3345712 RepID=UPI0035DED5BB